MTYTGDTIVDQKFGRVISDRSEELAIPCPSWINVQRSINVNVRLQHILQIFKGFALLTLSGPPFIKIEEDIVGNAAFNL